MRHLAPSSRSSALARARRSLALAALAAALGVGAASPARAEGYEDLPHELEGIGIDDRHDAQLPLDATFRDEQGDIVKLGDLITGEKPVILQLAYFRCPMLCGLVSNAMIDGLKGLAWIPGNDEFDVITVSIDARETPELARMKKENVIAALGKPGAERGWHFLTGSEANIAKLASTVGFRFRFMPERNDFAHAAGIFMITPTGKLSRTIIGMTYEPRTLRLSLVEAGEGKVGSAIDQVLLYCFHYDPKTGQYTPVVMNMMRVAGIVTVLALGSLIGGLVLQSRRAAARVALETAPAANTATETANTENTAAPATLGAS